MDVKELMIGDYCRVARNGLCIKYGTVVKIRSIDGDNRFPEKELYGCASCEPVNTDDFNGGIWVKYLEPIPLTSEILLKNGFVYNDLPFALTWEGHGLSIYGMQGNYRVSCGIDVSMDVSFVHQLQHLFRLCGISKEITI